jgi:hypothetical protein
MNDPFLDFEWPVWSAHEWVEVADQGGVDPFEGLANLDSCLAVEVAWQKVGNRAGPLLRPILTAGAPVIYRPMKRQHATLFREFADLDYRDRTELQLFAEVYGFLGIQEDLTRGESQLAWAREICLMREALYLAQPSTDATEAQERTIWSKFDEEMRAQWSRQGIDQDPAEFRARERRERLAWLFDLHLQYLQGRMRFEPDSPPRLRIAPLTLLAAMWLQLALAVAGDKRFLACKFCQKFFEISTEQTGFRSHREFCSESCKTQDYRKRKRTALGLAAKHRSVREIAKATNTAAVTVSGWIRSARGQKSTSGNRRRQ